MPQAEDDKDLRSLVIGHYVAAGGSLAVGLLYTAIPLVLSVLLERVAERQDQSAEDVIVTNAMGWMFSIGAAMIGAYFLLVLGSLVVVGSFVAKRRRYRECLGLSAFSATSLMFYNPFGPGAAGFTYKLLRRSSVQEQFQDTKFPRGPETRSEWDVKAASLACYVFAIVQSAAAVPGIGIILVIVRMPIEGRNEQAETFNLFMASMMAVVAAATAFAVIAIFGFLGYFLSRGQYRRVCMGLCIPLLLSFPFGTLVGILLLILLSRRDVAAVFDRSCSGTTAVMNG